VVVLFTWCQACAARCEPVRLCCNELRGPCPSVSPVVLYHQLFKTLSLLVSNMPKVIDMSFFLASSKASLAENRSQCIVPWHCVSVAAPFMSIPGCWLVVSSVLLKNACLPVLCTCSKPACRSVCLLSMLHTDECRPYCVMSAC